MIRTQDVLRTVGLASMALSFCLASASLSRAQQVGSYVIVMDDADILSGTTKVEHVTRGMALKVRGSRPGGWLWVTRYANGWIPSKKVVPLQTALNYLNAELSQQPQNAPLYNDRATVHFEVGNYAAAVQDYSHAISLAPGSVALRANRAVAYFEMEDFESAVRDLDEVVRRLPDDPQSYVDRGWALYHAGHYKEAVADFKQALELNPDSLQAEINLAWLQATCPENSFRDGKHAKQVAEKAMAAMENGDPFALATLAAAQAELGDYTAAAESQAKAVELAPYTRKKLYKERLAFYEADQPYRLGQTTPAPKPKTEVAVESKDSAEDKVADKEEPKGEDKDAAAPVESESAVDEPVKDDAAKAEKPKTDGHAEEKAETKEEQPKSEKTKESKPKKDDKPAQE